MASIVKRKNSYRITVSNGRDTSDRQILETTTWTPDPSKTERQNKKALDRFVIEFEDKIKSGKYLDGEKIAFGDFAEKWLQEYVVNRMSLKTHANYKDLLQRHIIPEIGYYKLSKVQPATLNTFYNKLLKERKDGKPGGYATKTIKNVHEIISSVYTTAIEWNVVMDNPCTRIKPPKQQEEQPGIKFFNLEQSQAFINYLNAGYKITVQAHDRVDDTGKQYRVGTYTEHKELPTQLKLFFNLALFCGMRRGELIALEWSDIDFIDNTISITKSTVQVNGKPHTKTPKTQSSIRTVSVPASIINLSKEYRKEQLQYQLSIGTKWEGSNYIFIQWNGRQMHPDSPYSAFKKTIKRYNEEITDVSMKLPDIPLHGLRHTSATLLISQNTDIRTVAARLGHSRTSTTTDIYAHSLQRTDQEAADTLEGLFNQKIKTK